MKTEAVTKETSKSKTSVTKFDAKAPKKKAPGKKLSKDNGARGKKEDFFSGKSILDKDLPRTKSRKKAPRSPHSSKASPKRSTAPIVATELRIRGPIPNVSNYESFKKGLKHVMNEDTAVLVEDSWIINKPLGLRVVRSDSDGIFRAIGYAAIEKFIFSEHIDGFADQ